MGLRGVSVRGMPLCQHCGVRAVKYPPRQLCRKCGVDPALRQQYRPMRVNYNQYAPGSRGAVYGAEASLVPTPARPGTLEKMDVMAERVMKGQPLHHPLDGRVKG
jgi:hypothetical protein